MLFFHVNDTSLYLPGSTELTGYGREYFLLEQGYEYINIGIARRGEARGKAIGESTGEKKSEAKLTLLLETLYDQGRDDEAKLAVRDMEARTRLYQELRIPRTLL